MGILGQKNYLLGTSGVTVQAGHVFKIICLGE